MTGESTHDWCQWSTSTDVPSHMAVVVTHAAMLSHAYLSVSCGRLVLLLNLEWKCLTADDRQQIKGIRRHCHHIRQRQTHLIFQSRLCHLCSWNITVSYRLRKKNQCTSIRWKWHTRSNTNKELHSDIHHHHCGGMFQKNTANERVAI